MQEHQSEANPRIYIFMWDKYGLEFCTDITRIEQINMFKIIKNEKLEIIPNLHNMILRAKINSHRCYEIYTMTVISGIPELEVREWFSSNPQYAAEQIRERGHKLYSDRTTVTTQVIT